jgi:hypothetical protein
VAGARQLPKPLKSETRARVITGIAQARLWLDQLVSGDVSDIATLARREDHSDRSVRSLLSLAFLAPEIVTAAVTNKLPRGVGITDLVDVQTRLLRAEPHRFGKFLPGPETLANNRQNLRPETAGVSGICYKNPAKRPQLRDNL